MDYSQHAAYFAGASQPAPYHQFPLGIAPLTPSHSNSAASEDFNNTSPPVRSSSSPPLVPFQCDLYLMRLLSNPLWAPLPPSPVPRSAARLLSGRFLLDGRAYTCLTQDAFDHYQGEQFQHFDQYATAHFNAQPPPPFPGPPTPPNHHSVAHNNGQPQPSHPGINGATGPAVKPPQPPGLAMTKPEPIGDLDRQGSNSADEEELTPAQSRRKAQNRAA